MDINDTSMSELLAVSLVLEWKILQSFFFSYTLRLISSGLKTFSTHLAVLLVCF